MRCAYTSAAVFMTLCLSVGLAASKDRKVRKDKSLHAIYVENEGELEIQCRKEENLVVNDLYYMCMEDFKANNLKAKRCDRKQDLLNAFNKDCANMFKTAELCKVPVKETNPRIGISKVCPELKCTEGTVLVGLYYCGQYTYSQVNDDEVAILYDLKHVAVNVKCPVGKVISVLNAGQRGSVLCNKGHVKSTLPSVAEKCNNLEQCSVAFDNSDSSYCQGLNQMHFVQYKCISPAPAAH